MKKVGEITLVAAGLDFEVDLACGGKIVIVMPDGQVIVLDVLDIINKDWYEDIA
ncbi:hypothetical protein [Cytobacillus gottheilii]|uniref:hypothetical protein n=1 Tax=Cytobacillus gottheilii TaxID=859144 RepID=UPI001592B174|nr:hypothetical protein [Cytobacillus gottheilii]